MGLEYQGVTRLYDVGRTMWDIGAVENGQLDVFV